MAPRILIFSIAMGADYSFYVKIIEIHARTFFKLIIFSSSSEGGGSKQGGGAKVVISIKKDRME